MSDDKATPQTDVATRALQAAAIVPLDTLCKRYVEHVLAVYRGNKTHAARALGISRRSLYRFVAKIDAANALGKVA